MFAETEKEYIMGRPQRADRCSCDEEHLKKMCHSGFNAPAECVGLMRKKKESGLMKKHDCSVCFLVFVS